MATVKKLPSGNWNAISYYKDPITGKVSRPSFTASSKSEAVRMAVEWEIEKKALPQEMTVRECIERYINVKEKALSESTIRVYRIMQSRYYSNIERISIKKLSDEDMQAFISDMCKTHSPKTTRNAYALLESSVSMFSRRQFRVTLPQKKNTELHIPNDDQVKILIDNACHSLKIAIALAATGTCRAGEVCALYYRDVDYSNNTIHVHADMIKNSANEWIIKDIPKTSASERYIPLPDAVMQLIGTGDPDQLIYGRKPSAIDSGFYRLRERVGIQCRFHDLRHYAASIMHALGIPDQYIMERGGWKSDNVLKSVYRNTLSDQSAKFARVANDHFEGLF